MIQHKNVHSSGAAIMVMFASPFETRIVDGALVRCVRVVHISIQQRLRIGALLCCRERSQMRCKKNSTFKPKLPPALQTAGLYLLYFFPHDFTENRPISGLQLLSITAETHLCTIICLWSILHWLYKQSFWGLIQECIHVYS